MWWSEIWSQVVTLSSVHSNARCELTDWMDVDTSEQVLLSGNIFTAQKKLSVAGGLLELFQLMLSISLLKMLLKLLWNTFFNITIDRIKCWHYMFLQTTDLYMSYIYISTSMHLWPSDYMYMSCLRPLQRQILTLDIFDFGPFCSCLFIETSRQVNGQWSVPLNCRS